MSWSHGFDVVVGESQVLLNLTEHTVSALREGIGTLARYLDDGPQQSGGFKDRLMFKRERLELLDRLLPRVSDYSPMAQEFIDRRGNDLLVELLEAARRVLASIPDSGPVRYQLAGVDDWIRVLGQARLVWVPRGTPGDSRSGDPRLRNAGLFTELQGQLVTALRPELAAQLTG
ncbi:MULTISPECIES: hypothetical protein [unclassified Kutzneria]|uniref:DUF2017 family protein n=1 Tax=unclassified Kutzneria TaxID=2621979 RepID=UPI0003EEB04D|nr:hypothetical protein [Kutzneria sp. 744]EWM13405.1 hypothetical protein KUTG_03709 [Kutzneria sp. 744]